MDPLWIVFAFVFGAAASRVGLPPLVGYLVAGFALNRFGIQGGESLAAIADAGVTLLLFTIGLKLKLRSLARPEVWAGASAHMLVTVAVFGLGLGLLAAAEMPFLRTLDRSAVLLIAFALSFSSTVFAVKVFEAKQEMPSRHAGTAIGILIMQDLFAVVFLAASTGKLPSPWAAALVAAVVVLRRLPGWLVSRCGHGELLMLFGILMAAAGYGSFEMVGLKGDLGALVFGMLLAPVPQADELAGRLLGFKDLFLVGFFLNIGIAGQPTLAAFGVAFLLALAVPFKAALFFGLLTRFRLRARTALLATLSLSNYSEFGLIVGAVGASKGWIGGEWLMILAMALSLTFILAAPLNAAAHRLYARLAPRLRRFETGRRLPEDAPIDTGRATIGIVGMGGVGASAYDEMHRRHGDVVIGMDFSIETVLRHRRKGRRVVHGDAADSDFWERFDPGESRIRLVMLALPDPRTGEFAVRQLQQRGYTGEIVASVRYEDEIRALEAAGIDAAYSLYEEAGVGFANHVCARIGYCRPPQAGPDG